MNPRPTVLKVANLNKRHARGPFSATSRRATKGSVGVLVGPSGRARAPYSLHQRPEPFHGGRSTSARSPPTTAAGTATNAGRPPQGRLRVPAINCSRTFRPWQRDGGPATCRAIAAGSRRTRALLTRVGLGDRLDFAPSQLSGGQQQRVAICRALAMQPEIVLFDEPTSALDPRMTAEVLAVMTDLARDGQTMLVVTHAMGFARRAAHEVHVMVDGVVVEAGPPDQIFENCQTEATRHFLEQVQLN